MTKIVIRLYGYQFFSIDNYSPLSITILLKLIAILLSIAILFYLQLFFLLSIAILFYQQLFFPIDSYSALSVATIFYWKPFCSNDTFSVLSIAILFYRQPFCSIDTFSVLLMWQIQFNYIHHQRMGILPLNNTCIYITCFGSQRMILNGF